MSTKVKVYPLGALSDEYLDRILNQIMEGVNDLGTLKNNPLEELPYGGRHTAPKVRRGEDLGMAMEDADIARAFSERDAVREQKRRADDMQEQMLKDMDRQAERRQKGWDIFCDTGILAAGACLVGTLQQHSLAWLIAAAVFT